MNMKPNFCPQCGAKVEAGMNFCPACGRKLNEPVDSTETTPPTDDDKPKPRPKRPKFNYPKKHERRSSIITDDASSGEPVVKFRKLHPNAVWLFFFQYMATTSILLLLFMLTIFVEPTLTIVLVAGHLCTTYLIAQLSYHSYRFEVSTSAFRKEHGIFHKYTVNIAFDQIQNINMRRSIVDQSLGLAHLEIETAGTSGITKRKVGALASFAEGYIPGITLAEANDVKALMLARIQATG